VNTQNFVEKFLLVAERLRFVRWDVFIGPPCIWICKLMLKAPVHSKAAGKASIDPQHEKQLYRSWPHQHFMFLMEIFLVFYSAYPPGHNFGLKSGGTMQFLTYAKQGRDRSLGRHNNKYWLTLFKKWGTVPQCKKWGTLIPPQIMPMHILQRPYPWILLSDAINIWLYDLSVKDWKEDLTCVFKMWSV